MSGAGLGWAGLGWAGLEIRGISNILETVERRPEAGQCSYQSPFSTLLYIQTVHVSKDYLPDNED